MDTNLRGRLNVCLLPKKEVNVTFSVQFTTLHAKDALNFPLFITVTATLLNLQPFLHPFRIISSSKYSPFHTAPHLTTPLSLSPLKGLRHAIIPHQLHRAPSANLPGGGGRPLHTSSVVLLAVTSRPGVCGYVSNRSTTRHSGEKRVCIIEPVS